jgi:hypothetical protein
VADPFFHTAVNRGSVPPHRIPPDIDPGTRTLELGNPHRIDQSVEHLGFDHVIGPVEANDPNHHDDLPLVRIFLCIIANHFFLRFQGEEMGDCLPSAGEDRFSLKTLDLWGGIPGKETIGQTYSIVTGQKPFRFVFGQTPPNL